MVQGTSLYNTMLKMSRNLSVELWYILRVGESCDDYLCFY